MGQLKIIYPCYFCVNSNVKKKYNTFFWPEILVNKDKLGRLEFPLKNKPTIIVEVSYILFAPIQFYL